MLHGGCVITGTRSPVGYRHGGVGIGFCISAVFVVFKLWRIAIRCQYEMLRGIIGHFGIPKII